MKKLKIELKLKDTTVYPAGTPIERVGFAHNTPFYEGTSDMSQAVKDSLVFVTINGRVIRLSAAHAHKYLPGFTKPPTTNTIGRWMYDGMAKTITGHTTEPDGHGPDGSPSWLLVLGLI